MTRSLPPFDGRLARTSAQAIGTTNSIIALGCQRRGVAGRKAERHTLGLAVAQAAFLLLAGDTRFNSTLSDGDRVVPGQRLLELSGSARTILQGERTALSFLGRMSGIATLTRRFVNAVAGTKARILDTRKTAPGLRALDKLAVRHGGGENHRFGLYDMILIKNNHTDYVGSLSKARRSRVERTTPIWKSKSKPEPSTRCRKRWRWGSNESCWTTCRRGELLRAVALCAGRAKLEASGNGRLDNVPRDCRKPASTSSPVGALTHSAPAFDVQSAVGWIIVARQPGGKQ